MVSSGSSRVSLVIETVKVWLRLLAGKIRVSVFAT